MTNGEAASFSSASLARRSGFLQQPRHQKPETGQHTAKRADESTSGKTHLKTLVFLLNEGEKSDFSQQIFFSTFVTIEFDSALTGKWHEYQVQLLLILLFYRRITSILRPDTQLTSLRGFFPSLVLKTQTILTNQTKPQQDICQTKQWTVLPCQFLSTSFAFLLVAI